MHTTGWWTHDAGFNEHRRPHPGPHLHPSTTDTTHTSKRTEWKTTKRTRRPSCRRASKHGGTFESSSTLSTRRKKMRGSCKKKTRSYGTIFGSQRGTTSGGTRLTVATNPTRLERAPEKTNRRRLLRREHPDVDRPATGTSAIPDGSNPSAAGRSQTCLASWRKGQERATVNRPVASTTTTTGTVSTVRKRRLPLKTVTANSHP